MTKPQSKFCFLDCLKREREGGGREVGKAKRRGDGGKGGEERVEFEPQGKGKGEQEIRVGE